MQDLSGLLGFPILGALSFERSVGRVALLVAVDARAGALI